MGQSCWEIRAGGPGVEKALQTDVTSAQPAFTREGGTWETLTHNPSRLRSPKQTLLATISSACGLACGHPPEQGQAPSTVRGSPWSPEKRLLSHNPTVKAQALLCLQPPLFPLLTLLAPCCQEAPIPHPSSPTFSPCDTCPH